MRRFRFHWKDGKVTEQEGFSVVDAAKNDGLTLEDLDNLDRVEEV